MRAIETAQPPQAAQAADDPPLLAQLTERERQIARLVAEGRSNGEVAAALGIGQGTVKNHLAHNMLAYQEAGADIIMPIGYGSGGCGPRHRIPMTALIDEYSALVDVPLLAAGGIVDAAGARAAAALGAGGAYVGTRFLASVESPCSDGAKQVILDARAEDLVEMPVSAGLVRCTRTPMSERVLQMVGEGATVEEIDAFTGINVGFWMSMRDGNNEDYAVGMDAAVNMVTELKTAAEIVDDIASGFGA